MKQWADQVEQLSVRRPECRRISDRILRGEPLLGREKGRIKQDVNGACGARRARVRDGVTALQAREFGKHTGGITMSSAQELQKRSDAEEWLETLLKRWTSLTPEVRGQLQTYMGLPPRDRKNQRRLEKKLKTAACKSETFRHDSAERKVHS